MSIMTAVLTIISSAISYLNLQLGLSHNGVVMSLTTFNEAVV